MSVLRQVPRLSTSSVPRRSSFSTPQTFAGGVGIRHGHFIDAQGRVLLLRGVNLGGSSKLPTHYQHAGDSPLNPTDFYDNAHNVTFVDRPFPLEQADVHFARLRRWGLSFIRFVITWEAIEHQGPGVYDQNYLSYLRAIIDKAHAFGLLIYIDPHQDVWSRWTGGDGAPMWTLEAIGLEPRHLNETKAALCMETTGQPPASFPKMIWPTNYFKFACATMFTLFFAGQRFAPSCRVNGVQVQEFLQSHYLNAMAQVAKALVGCPNIVGFGTMNEPSAGFIGVQDLSQCFHATELKYGYAPTPFQGMCLADGIPQDIGVWSNGFMQHVLGRPDRTERIDPHGQRAWKPGFRCIWMDEGVWKVEANGSPRLLRADYFANVDFGRDCYVPFATEFAQVIRSILSPSTMIFVELPPLEFSNSPFPTIAPEELPKAVNASHWYDGVTLFLRTWRPWFSVDPKTKWPAFGRRAVRALHQKQLQHIQSFGRKQMHNAPTLIGETGIPFNLNHATAYKTGDYSAPIEALDHTISCLEATMCSYTLWCYTSGNVHPYGDLWNLEDLSLVSLDTTKSQAEDQDDACARALLAFARPYGMKIAGLPSMSQFDRMRRCYVLEYASDVGKQSEHIVAPTEIFVPRVQFPQGYTVSVSDGTYDIHRHEQYDIVVLAHDEKVQHHKVCITTNDLTIEQAWKQQQQRETMVVSVCVGVLVLLLVLFIRLAL